MNELDVRLLRAFLVLLAERSVSRAAGQLRMSQPAISHVLRRLRLVFGDELLLKSRGGMIPTDRALQLEGQVRLLLASYDELVKPVREFEPSTSTRRFVLTAPESAEHMLMPGLMRHLRAQAPGIRVDVRAPDPGRAYELLESGAVDLRIAWLLKPMASLRSQQLFQDEMVYIADRKHPSVRGTLSLPQFLALPHLRTYGQSVSASNQVIDEALDRLGKKLRLVFYLQNFLTMPRILMGSDAIAAWPRRLALQFADEYPLQLLDLPIKVPRIRFAAYWHERNQRDPGHRWLRQAVQATARALDG
jgi:DNA-binding transcriptional LysR family regulator